MAKSIWPITPRPKTAASSSSGARSTTRWNKAVQLYLPFAPDAEKESLKLQFLCDLTQREVNGLREVAPAESPGTPPAQSASPAGPPP